jgi:hypothetical protein
LIIPFGRLTKRLIGESRVLMPLNSVHPEMVDFGLGQGRSDFETAGVVMLRRGFQKSENAGLGRKMPFMDGH